MTKLQYLYLLCVKSFSFRFCFLLNVLDNDKVVRALIELGANVNAKDNSEQTPLHEAAGYGKSLIHLTLEPYIGRKIKKARDE